METLEIEKLEKELTGILKKFNVPEHRKTSNTIHNYKWLHKNIGLKNSEKDRFARAMEILDILVKVKK